MAKDEQVVSKKLSREGETVLASMSGACVIIFFHASSFKLPQNRNYHVKMGQTNIRAKELYCTGKYSLFASSLILNDLKKEIIT